MNTMEARRRLGELTRQAVGVVQCLAQGDPVTSSTSIVMRDILREAREVTYDAGYPGDAAWRALLRTNVYITAPPTTVSNEFWSELLEDLRVAMESLTGIEETAEAT